MIFFALLAQGAGHPLDPEAMQPETFLAAMIAAFSNDEAALPAEIRKMV
jgi:cell filamentation protein